MATSHLIPPGTIFGRLTVLSREANSWRREARWLCICTCGKQTIVPGRLLRSGNTRSCGCLHRKHGKSETPEFIAWLSLIARCYNPNDKGFRFYGGRGITVCDRWLESFLNFLADMGERPGPSYSIDRFPDNDGNYEPGNCRWATRQQQCRNRRSNRLLTCDGQTRTLAEWVEITGLSSSLIRQRIASGWTIERTLSTPQLPPGRPRR
jgi:hypothetical protein